MKKGLVQLFDESRRELKKMDVLAKKVDALDDAMQKLSDEQLAKKTEEFKARLTKGETLDDLLPEAFAVVREAAFRVLQQKPFYVQILGAIALHQGDIAEMKTGEGKTLTSLMPAYLNALLGQGVHIITVNEYLAGRDAAEMGQVYNFLGLTVGLNINSLNAAQKQEAYAADITYATNSEVGFDYLRDNMVLYAKDKVQRPLNYAIIDEVDSILIDESRTPLIISGGKKQTAPLYHAADSFVKKLKEGDYEIDYEAKSIQLTPEGISKAEQSFHTDNIFSIEHTELIHRIMQSLRANYVMQRDVEYVVADGEVKIVDQFTGRILDGRRYNDGLHQALEAKEHVNIEEETSTLATITYQNYFRLYKKLSGMTGTAKTEEEEFLETYNMRVISIPTNQPVIREDEPDLLFGSLAAKYNALINEIEERHEKGQPILVGTVAVESSEVISKLLKERKIRHEVLNAKNHEREADIIAQAGQKGAVTIATNMAGRGTDIKLGDGVPALGGLAVLGSERHESRRIDNQLRGRSGRQGDAGYSRFFISFEDELMLRFGNQQLLKRLLNSTMQDEALESKQLAKQIESAQKQIEGVNHDIRKQILQYDDVLRRQRDIIYAQRDSILYSENIDTLIQKMMQHTAKEMVEAISAQKLKKEARQAAIGELVATIKKDFLADVPVTEEAYATIKEDDLRQRVEDALLQAYAAKKDEVSEETFEEFQKVIALRMLDQNWMRHISAMGHLRESIHLRGYAQRNPVYAYQEEGYDMYEAMTMIRDYEISQYIVRAQIVDNLKRKEAVKGQSANRGGMQPEEYATEKKRPTVTVEPTQNTKAGKKSAKKAAKKSAKELERAEKVKPAKKTTTKKATKTQTKQTTTKKPKTTTKKSNEKAAK